MSFVEIKTYLVTCEGCPETAYVFLEETTDPQVLMWSRKLVGSIWVTFCKQCTENEEERTR